ncbi:hypothetical protein M501DRAFT_971006 [Patellaria atrata CBS 101060]|uniref:Uncharacterized protein n=1 Tax=Patellaria atrata CBS 101060 TaxID=1346257 RepID=A0A9P4SDJ9_9PEZI|nr:hypothetical protein M501DRAFT_971006 [Patellaria atrata CBS 101060]
MTDSPFARAPLDEKEKPILDRLLEIRTNLELLKQDKSTYVKSQDVIDLYNQVIENTAALNDLRTHKRTEQTRVDTVLDDCFQLISLAFLTIGKNAEAPAVYSALSTMKRLLDHLKEANFFTPKDLAGLDGTLQKYRECITRCDHYSPHLLTLLETRIEVCQNILSELQQKISSMTSELSPTYEKLVSILRCLSACNTRSKFPEDDVKDLQNQLKEIQAKLNNEKKPKHEDENTLKERVEHYIERIKMEDTPTPSAEKLVDDLLERCLLWAEIVLKKQGKIEEGFEDVYRRLMNIRNTLERLQLTQAWSLRETDLYSYQRQLDRIDEARALDGNFVDAEGNKSNLHTQRTLLYLLRKSYALIYHLIISSEPVSEALLPIYNQLLTLRRCLIEVKKDGGVSSPRELYPYSMKLNSIDNMRVDGKFMIGEDIPDGQGAVTQLLEECFELAYELRNDAEEAEEDESSTDEDEKVELRA